MITDFEIESLRDWGERMDPLGRVPRALDELLALRTRVAEVEGQRDRCRRALEEIAEAWGPFDVPPGPLSEAGFVACGSCAAINDTPHSDRCAYELARAALAPPPPASTGDRVTSLECDHCGDVAIESALGLLWDGDGGHCSSCGYPGQVSGDSETPPYWVLSDDDDAHCARSDCEDDPCVAARGPAPEGT